MIIIGEKIYGIMIMNQIQQWKVAESEIIP